jgi:hypothetical protein
LGVHGAAQVGEACSPNCFWTTWVWAVLVMVIFLSGLIGQAPSTRRSDSRHQSGVAKQPRLARTVLGFKRRNRVAVLQGQADVVQAIEQAVLAERVDLEVDTLPSGRVTVWACRSMATGSPDWLRPA